MTRKNWSKKKGEELTSKYFDLLQNDKWQEVAEMYDPDSLADFRNMMSPIADDTDPDDIHLILGDEVNQDNVSDVDFFKGFLKATMSMASEIGETNFRNIEIIGSVPEGDSMRHIVVRTNTGFGTMNIEKVEILSCTNKGDGWKLIMQGKFEGMIEQFTGNLDELDKGMPS